MNDDDDITPIADPEIVSHLIYYMYHFDYLPATTAHSAEGQSTKRRKTLSDFLNGTPVPEYADPVTHALMYAVADFYGVSGLKYVAREKYAATMKEHVDHPHCADSISIVYSMTPESDRGLRDIVLQHLGSSLNRLADPALNATVREVKGLAFELLEYNFAGNKKSPDPTRFSTESVREWNSVQKGCVKIPPSVQSTMMPRTR